MTDDRTGKQYMVMAPGQASFTKSQAMCTGVGGYLPEPRDQWENSFLGNLTSDTFYLGIRNFENSGKSWQFETDSTDVTWRNWAVWVQSTVDSNYNGVMVNCAMMLKRYLNGTSGHKPEAWTGFHCGGPSAYGNTDMEMTVVCEKGEDKCIRLCIYIIK